MKLFTKNLRTLQKRSSQKGQSLAEMVIGMTILVMLMSGVVDIGRAYFTYVALEDAAGEAAVYMSAFPDCPYDGLDDFGYTQADDQANKLPGPAITDTDNPNGTTGWECDPPNNAKWRLENSGGTGGLINWSDKGKSEVTITCVDTATDNTISCASAGTGDLVIVKITYQVRLLSPFIPDITGTPTIPLTGTAIEVITAPQ